MGRIANIKFKIFLLSKVRHHCNVDSFIMFIAVFKHSQISLQCLYWLNKVQKYSVEQYINNSYFYTISILLYVYYTLIENYYTIIIRYEQKKKKKQKKEKGVEWK